MSDGFENNTSFLFLPKLKDGESDVGVPSSGQWEVRPAETYQKIASSLDLGGVGDGQQIRNVTSIPNPWARALLMESAMHNLGYPQRSQLIRSWRGMLAAFALAEVKQFDIKAKLIRLEGNQDRFARSLYKLLPEPTYALYSTQAKTSNPWQDLYVFLWQGRSVGISSPSTLVCHAENGDWTGLPWFRENRLLEPSASDLNVEEQSFLCLWLDNLITKLPANKYFGNAETRNTFTGELRSFIKDLEKSRNYYVDIYSNIPLTLSEKDNFFGEEINVGALELINKPVIHNPWATALVMESAIQNPSYPQRDQMIQQWRGMLAAFALAEVKEFDLKAKLINLKDSDDAVAKSLYRTLPKPKYSLYSLQPEVTNPWDPLKPDEVINPWQDLYEFSLDGRRVGISSPSTLVCPDKNVDWSGLPWGRGNRVSEPNASDLIGEEKALLWLWLDKLINELPSYDANPSAGNAVIEELKKFRDNFGKKPSGITLTLSEKDDFFGEQINRGALKLLNKPFKVQSKESSVRLISKKTDVPELLIIDLELDKQWHPWRKQEIYVYGDKNLASKDLLADLRNKGKQWQDSNKKAVTWRLSEEMLLSEIYFIGQQEAFSGSLLDTILGIDTLTYTTYEGEKITILLPINRLLLDYFTPTELASKIEIKYVRDTQNVEIILNLQLSGIGEQCPKNYRYAKQYTLKDENRLTSFPILEIWPNFQARGWKDYYMFYAEQAKNKQTFQVKVSSGGKSPSQGKHQELVDVTRDTTWNYEWFQLNEFPTHIICHNGADAKKELGIILLSPPNLVNDVDNGNWKVGVDFGTSFTNVYVNKNGDVQQLVLDPLHFSVTNPNPDERAGALIEFFTTDVEDILKLPLSTVLTTRVSRDRNVEGKRQTDVMPHFDGCIYIPPKDSSAKTKENYIKTGLKWSTSNSDRVITKLFLKHLALQISALAAKESIRSIEWFISFPSAFSRADQSAYFGIWRDITDELNQITGIQHIYPEDTSDLSHWRSESVAIAQYFADRENENLVASTCIDVGGGTSDISVWENNRLLHQCSIQFAGKHLLTQFLELNPKLLIDQFKSPYVDWQNLKGTRFAVELDLLLRRNGSEWLKNNRDTLLASNKEFEGLLQLSALATSGLYYYIGIILNVLHSVEKKYRKGEITPIFLGGNGANFWHWLSDSGRFDKTSQINGLFSKMLENGSKFANARTRNVTRLSNKLKDEVACGLVLDNTKLRGWDEGDWTKEQLIAGEYCLVNGKAISPYERLPASGKIDFDYFEVPTSLDNLRQFVTDFNEATTLLEIQGIKPVQVTDEDFSDAHTELVRALLASQGGDSDAIRIEPPFILALKALLSVLGKKWAGK